MNYKEFTTALVAMYESFKGAIKESFNNELKMAHMKMAVKKPLARYAKSY